MELCRFDEGGGGGEGMDEGSQRSPVPQHSLVPPWRSAVLKVCLVCSVVWFPHRWFVFIESVGYHLKL